jgi:hypothetical protein
MIHVTEAKADKIRRLLRGMQDLMALTAQRSTGDVQRATRVVLEDIADSLSALAPQPAGRRDHNPKRTRRA